MIINCYYCNKPTTENNCYYCNLTIDKIYHQYGPIHQHILTQITPTLQKHDQKHQKHSIAHHKSPTSIATIIFHHNPITTPETKPKIYTSKARYQYATRQNLQIQYNGHKIQLLNFTKYSTGQDHLLNLETPTQYNTANPDCLPLLIKDIINKLSDK